MKIVHFNLYDPSSSLFKSAASEKAQIQYVECSCEDCPLVKNGQCAATRFMGHCIYGKFRREEGYTRRANNFRRWIETKRQEFANIPYLSSPPNKIAFIGDYVYLPYAHMNHLDSPGAFGQKSHLFSSGSDFLPKEHWNVKTVLALINFRPQALFGGEIASYQKEQVPLFIEHIREVDPDMWRQLIEIRPDLNKEPNYIGRLAKLNTLNYPIKIQISDAQYEWTGKELVTQEDKPLSFTHRTNVASCEIRIVPKDNVSVKVMDNAWVNSNTEFLD